MEPTPDKQNAQIHNALEKSSKPQFDKESGFYSGTQQIHLSQENNAVIYYTTDGSIPTRQSKVYTQPITISKTTIIRARALESGKFLSSVVNHTYLIDENVHLPVFSIGIDAKYLYDPDIGIYTKGNYDNFRQDWMRPGSVEYIENGQTEFDKNIGIKIHGNNTRVYPQKSLAIYSKEKYGSKSISYPLFADKPFIKKVKSFVLRSGGTEWGRTLIGDGVQHQIVKDTMDLDNQSFQSVVVFINGQYWGIHHIREKLNADYLEANHGVDPDNVDLLANDAEIQDGTNKEYIALKNYIKSHDLSNDTYYQYVASKIDLNEYINYIITESFTSNSSIHHNIKYWKKSDSTGKWRWILFDLDRGFRYSENTLYFVADDDETSIVFRNLLKNRQFVHLFASRYFTHLNTTFQPDRVKAFITRAKDIVAPEIPRHFSRWPKDKDGKSVSESTWRTFINNMYDFADARPNKVISDLRNAFHLQGHPVLHIPSLANGTVYLDNVKLSGSFDGNYFDGATVTLKALPKKGYKFTGWSNGSSSQTINLTLHNDITVSATYELAQTPKVVINEINYASDKNHDSGDWIELYNNDTKAIDLSEWVLKDDKDVGAFTFPANTVLQPNHYIVVTQNRSDFTTQYPGITDILGDFGFGLSKKGDSVRLFNTQGALTDSVTFDKNWPDANGNGKTLALIDPNSDNSISTNWIAADNFGTPGEVN